MPSNKADLFPPPALSDDDARKQRVMGQTRQRFFRFVALEALAFVALFGSVAAAAYLPPWDGIFTGSTIAAAIAVVLVPVVFYGPTRSR